MKIPSWEGAVKKFGWSYKHDPAGTRRSASVLGLSSRTRSSASLPLNSFTAPGDRSEAATQIFHSSRGGALAPGWVGSLIDNPPQGLRPLPLPRGDSFSWIVAPQHGMKNGEETELGRS